MNLGEIREDVTRRLRDVGVFWESSEIDISVNEGYQEIADNTEFYEKFQTIDILKDRPYYDMRTVARQEFLVAGPAFNETTSRWLISSNVSDLDMGDLRWESRAAEPERAMVRGLWWVAYWPVKSIAQGSIRQYYAAIPPALVEDTDEPLFHHNFHYGLVEYALFDLFAQDSEVDLAWQSWRAYIDYEAKLAAYMDRRLVVPRVHGAKPSAYGS